MGDAVYSYARCLLPLALPFLFLLLMFMLSANDEKHTLLYPPLPLVGGEVNVVLFWKNEDALPLSQL